jgi:hypothetical protein
MVNGQMLTLKTIVPRDLAFWSFAWCLYSRCILWLSKFHHLSILSWWNLLLCSNTKNKLHKGLCFLSIYLLTRSLQWSPTFGNTNMDWSAVSGFQSRVKIYPLEPIESIYLTRNAKMAIPIEPNFQILL